LKDRNVVDIFNEGKIIFPDDETDAKKLNWYEHPAFNGVFLKDLVSGKETGGAFSCHIIRVNKGCEVGQHLHEDQWEFNEVLAGDGVYIYDNKEVRSGAGFSFATPPGVRHALIAGVDDLYLLAKFIPATV